MINNISHSTILFFAAGIVAINKKYAFSQFSEAGLITLKITDTTTSKYWYELQICATNQAECL